MAFTRSTEANKNGKVMVIIPAAGKSQRMGGEIPKIFMEVDGLPVIVRTVKAFQEFANSKAMRNHTMSIVVVAAPDLVFKIQSLFRNYGISVNEIVAGGDTRTESVANGIVALGKTPFPPQDNDIVFVHDGARCMIDQDTLTRCLQGAYKYDIVAAAVPVKSTIKVTDPTADSEEPLVDNTPKRDELKEVQTPQVFRCSKIVKCYDLALKSKIDAPDDSSLAEQLNFPVHLVDGAYTNIKITTPEDIVIAEAFLKQQDN